MTQHKGSHNKMDNVSDNDDHDDDDLDGDDVQCSDLHCVHPSIQQLAKEVESKKAILLTLIENKMSACCKHSIGDV